MRYTEEDYNQANTILYGCKSRRARLAPQEQRLLAALCVAYGLESDVPLSEVKIARAIFEHSWRRERSA